MDSKTVLQDICYVCLCKEDDRNLHKYVLAKDCLKKLLRMDTLWLCYLCKRMAEHTESFIQNVQSNQILLGNSINSSDAMFQALNYEVPPIIKPVIVQLDFIEITKDNSDITEPVTIVYSNIREDVTKLQLKEENTIEIEIPYKFSIKEEDEEVGNEMKEEYMDINEEYEDLYVKQEETNSLPIKSLLKDEMKLNNLEISGFRSSTKKGKVKKNHRIKNLDTKNVRNQVNNVSELPCFKKFRITLEECMQERLNMMKDKKYVNLTFKCENCIKGFNFKPSYMSHLEKHSKDAGDFECDICKQRMDSEEKLISHRKIHFERFRCPDCGVTRVDRRNMKDHYKTTHCNLQCRYTCPKCSKIFNREESLRKHILYHNSGDRRVQCGHCGKTYANRDALKTHLGMRHSEVVSSTVNRKWCVCPDCGMAFRSPSHLKSHSIKHSLTRDHYCVECDKSFKSEAILKHHLKTASPHINYAELTFKCEHCEKRFAIRRDVERHTNRVHLNIKPFQCDSCDKAYVCNWSLVEHKRKVHEGFKRPLKHPCSMCDKVFDRQSILKSHIRTHTGERPYQCSKCPAQFSQSSILGTHYKLIHLKLTRDGRPKGGNTINK